MTRPAIQLYSVRDLDESLANVVRRVADAGFVGVEFAQRFHRAALADVAAAIDETGVEPVGVHVGLRQLEDDADGITDRLSEVGCRRVVVPHVSPSHFRTERRVRDLARRLGRLSRELDDRGFDLVYHNVRHDLRPPLAGPGARLLDSPLVPGMFEGPLDTRVLRTGPPTPLPAVARTGLGSLLAHTDPADLSLEVDVGEVVAAGHDPATVLADVSDRSPLIHVCDVVRSGGEYASTSLGTGDVAVAAAARAARQHGAEWLVYEHDDPDDPVETIRRGAEAVRPLCLAARPHTS